MTTKTDCSAGASINAFPWSSFSCGLLALIGGAGGAGTRTIFDTTWRPMATTGRREIDFCSSTLPTASTSPPELTEIA
eukprot:CAMPEP_0170604626 /NCGR_PEP_ID=MMETSP0224-20130122/19527_1 /TAXON_ID=285029 /ORGANISM="Togula jolla, Strain CCCM 725" /LENGTH=77 /DNA_ID=CAMNT_0010929549 /DNA_START=183 /DNA_END=416 /DNA_ORIENTATION=+